MQLTAAVPNQSVPPVYNPDNIDFCGDAYVLIPVMKSAPARVSAIAAPRIQLPYRLLLQYVPSRSKRVLSRCGSAANTLSPVKLV